jgi:transcriptional regulator with XRE-family HTH domain
MSVNRITGSRFHAGRVLAGLSREVLAERAGLCRHTILSWEKSSDAIPAATYSHFLRALDVLEAEGVRFSEDGVYLQRPTPISTVLHSEGARRGRTIRGEIAERTQTSEE